MVSKLFIFFPVKLYTTISHTLGDIGDFVFLFVVLCKTCSYISITWVVLLQQNFELCLFILSVIMQQICCNDTLTPFLVSVDAKVTRNTPGSQRHLPDVLHTAG